MASRSRGSQAFDMQCFLWTEEQAGRQLPLAVGSIYLGVTSSRCSRCPGSGRVPVFEAVPVYTKCTRTTGGSLLDRLSMNSEPIETCVLRMAPVGKNPKLHYLESSIRSFLKSKGEGSHLIHSNTPGPITSPTLRKQPRWKLLV